MHLICTQACISGAMHTSLHSGGWVLFQVQKRPLKVAVEHLKDLPYNSGDDIVKATYMELVSTLKDLLAQHPIYREQLQSSFQFGSDFQDMSRLSDMAAALTSAQETDLQNVLAELSIPDRFVMPPVTSPVRPPVTPPVLPFIKRRHCFSAVMLHSE